MSNHEFRAERDLVQIVYVSAAASAMTAAEVEVFAEQARIRSASARLTGLLLRHGAHFYAVIEGPRRRVFDRIEEIIVEQGQRGLEILREQAIAGRRFASWSYGDIPVTGRGSSAPSEFLWRFCGLPVE